MPNAGDIVYAPGIGCVIASASETADSATFTTTETTIGTVTATLVSGNVYLVSAEAQVSSTVANDVVAAVLREDTIGGTGIDLSTMIVAATSDFRPTTIQLRRLYTAVATGSKTFVVTAFRQSGTGNIRREASSGQPQLVTVTWVGP